MSFLRLMNAGGSRITTSKRSPRSPSDFRASKASACSTSSATLLRSALRRASSSAASEASTQSARAAPWRSAATAQAPTYEHTSSTRARDAPYRRLDLVLERLHAGGRDLADDEVAVTIEHEPRQQVRLAEHPAAVLRLAELLAQDERRREPPLDERAVHRLSRVAGQDARADERVRIDAHVAEERIARSAQLRHRADIEGRERRAGGVDLVAEHPQVPRGEAPL